MLCTEGGAGNTEVFKIIHHINFKALRYRWQKLLLDYLSNNLPECELSNFKKLKNQIYKDYNNGFYVYAKPDNISSIKQTIDYVVRYTGRPAMAQSRIINYDGEHVTFWYDRHEDGKRVEETVHVYEFIKRLIKHIPDKNFKMVRYYGLYAKEHKQSSKIFKLLTQTQIEIREQLRKWHLSIELSFGYDPTICDCGGHFIFFELKVPSKVLQNISYAYIMSLVILMKNNKNKYLFANEVEEMKDNFKKMINSMSDADFLNFIEYINSCSEMLDEETLVW